VFPFIDRVGIILQLAEGFDSAAGSGTRINLTHLGGTTEFELQSSAFLGGLLYTEQALTTGLGDWSVEVIEVPDGLRMDDSNRLNPEAIADIGIICHYNVEVS
jgi:hypothetical protein